MPTFQLNKLIRGKLLEKQREAGQTHVLRPLDKTEHIQSLIDKIQEESSEILESDSPAAEIADVQQAIDDLMKILGVNRDDVATEQSKKLENNGGFLDGIYVETITMSENDPWASYYRTDPGRFPEIS